MNDYKFIDLFSGCGGFSLGLSQAGLHGQFAIERDPMAFETFSTNMLGDRQVPVKKFAWPSSWLEAKAWSIDDLLDKHGPDLARLKGEIQVIAGGPPCQGFSFAGRRLESDPRNQLFEKYVQVVEAIQPMALILENVPGMMISHSSKSRMVRRDSSGELNEDPESYYVKLKQRLDEIGYQAVGRIVDASLYGVPQKRSRLIVIGIRKELACHLHGGVERAFEILKMASNEQLVSAKMALSDLETVGSDDKPLPLQECTDPKSPRNFKELVYTWPETDFQRSMHKGAEGVPMNSIRMARHGDTVRNRFISMLKRCPKGVNISVNDRFLLGLKKHRTILMAPDQPAPTITTLPDDILHYSEPRILTVRECARLQTFPDWFHFRGKFTTGGKQRTKECPRYTQVGNAVPPTLAKAIGLAIKATLEEARAALAIHEKPTKEKQLMAIA